MKRAAIHPHERIPDELPTGGRLDFMAEVMRTLGAVDARYESTVVASARVAGQLELAEVRERARAELLQYWPFRCVVAGGRWVELSSIDVNALVTARTVSSEHELCAYVGDSFAQPWDWALPLWRIELVTLASAPRNSVLLVRMHHCLADGVTMLKMFLSVFDGGRDNAIDPPRRRKPVGGGGGGGGARAPKWQGPLEGALAPLPQPLRPLAAPLLAFARSFWIALTGASYAAALPLLPADTAHALKLRSCAGPTGLAAKRVVGTGARIPFSDVREVKEAFGCTVNDVLVACVAGAVRAVQLARAPSGGEAALARVRALLPVSMRAEDVDPLASIGNEWTLLPVDLPARAADAESRLRQSILALDELKQSPELSVLHAVNKLGLAVLPRGVFAQTSFDTMDKFSVLLSNVAGPDRQLRFRGHAVDSLAFFATSLVGACFDVISYDGALQLAVLADPAVLGPDRSVAPLLAAFEAEMHALLAAARAPPRSRGDAAFDGRPWRRLAGFVAIVAGIAYGAAAAAVRRGPLT